MAISLPRPLPDTGQVPFAASKASMPGFFGAAGTGKTEQEVAKVLEVTEETGCDALVVARDLKLIRRAALIKYTNLGRDGFQNPDKPFNENQQVINLKKGNRIWFASCEIPENLWGPEVGIVAFEEACLIEERVTEPEDCQTLRACLSRKRQKMPPGWPQQLIATGTPKGVDHWTYKVWADPRRTEAQKHQAPWWGMTIYENFTLYDRDEEGNFILYALDHNGDLTYDENDQPILDPSGQRYSQYIRDQELTFGTNSDYARQELYGEWIVQSKGRIFQQEWFPRYDERPGDIIAIIASWDTAGTTKEWSSYTVGEVWAVTTEHHYYLLDMIKDKVEYAYIKEGIRDVAKHYNAAGSLIEDKGSGQQALQELALEGVRVFAFKPGTQDKASRASQASIAAQEGRVHLPSEKYALENGITWLADFEDEVFRVPFTVHWDVTDAFTQFILWAEQRRHTVAPRILTARVTYGRRVHARR